MKPSLLVEIPQENMKSYPIYIEKDSIHSLAKKLNEQSVGRRRLIVISKKVYKLYNQDFNFSKDELFILKDGEDQKNMKNYLKIVEKAVSLGLSRKDLIIAIGGGVVGDLAGFVAATYMRGIESLQVPTTLLSFVDSSVGGKTGLDLPNAKNYVGAFYQPSMVFINLNFILTLDKKQILSGFGEVLKYAFIEASCKADKSHLLIEFLSIAADRILDNNMNLLERLIKICLELKISVVTKDETESNLRKVLNFGHTFGHALETITNFRKFTHGEAVVYGMMFAFDYALELKMINQTYYNLAFDLFDRYGYKPLKHNFDREKLIDIMKHDKKSNQGKITMILPDKKGSVTEHEVDDEYTFIELI